MPLIRKVLLAAALLLVGAPLAAADRDAPVVRLAVLKFGTVSWLADAIAANGLDAAAGYRLEVMALAGAPATAVAFLSGEADLIVEDWIWSQRRRDAGEDVRFAPYSVSLGALMSRSGVASLCDLDGGRIGVVGGESDKSWLIYRALSRELCGFDLAERAELLFGAPPLMARQFETGAVDAVSTYWHWAAKLQAAGAHRLLGAEEAMAALGIVPAPPLVGFVWNADRLAEAEAAAFLASVDAARTLLLHDDAEWRRLRPRMNAANDAEFLALRDRFREGIAGAAWSDDRLAAARRLHALLTALGGPGFATAGALDAEGFAAPAPANGR
ncbi:MAG: ABC transporter substrate-binding protein [Paracoccaceae bacterium]